VAGKRAYLNAHVLNDLGLLVTSSNEVQLISYNILCTLANDSGHSEFRGICTYLCLSLAFPSNKNSL
jgi:hypothetical protein